MSYNPETGLVHIPAQIHWTRYGHDEDLEFQAGVMNLGVAFSSGLGIIAPPITYELDGVQYVTVAADWGGPGRRAGSPPGEAANYEQRGRLMSFAPDRDEPRPPLSPRRPLPELADLGLAGLGLPEDPGSVDRGHTRFQSNCALCRGGNADADGSIPSLIRMAPASHRAFQTADGRGDTPSGLLERHARLLMDSLAPYSDPVGFGLHPSSRRTPPSSNASDGSRRSLPI